jgi:hypothetical protein
VFDLNGIERLAKWKQCRDQLEIDNNPFEVCAKFWAKAPFINNYLDPYNCQSWPDPWQLILNSKYDNLAIALGMLYTLQLTSRFMRDTFEIYMTSNNEKNDKEFYLLVSGEHVLNLEYAAVTGRNRLLSLEINKIYTVGTIK